MIPASQVARFTSALPFWLSLTLLPMAWIGAVYGGLWVLLLLVCTWYLFSALDAAIGLNLENADLSTSEDQLFFYRAVTIVWVPLQAITLYGIIYYATRAEHLSGWELCGLFFSVGIMTGTIGINYSHELMHQKDKREQWLGDILGAMVLYSHFRSEHLKVHHIYVGTPGDPVTARYNESFFRFFPRVLYQSLVSAFKAEADMLQRRNLPWHHRSNPFWRYWGLQTLMLALALVAGGWLGLGLFIFQAFIAVWHLELVNYVEHYGLTRKHLGEGKYEHVKPHHSWNAAHRASNWLLINLQRHSDHHYKPDRRFPLLQNYTEAEAPQLPFGYPIMGMAAMAPPIWRRVMNKRVRRWREMYYPEITDWKAYNKHKTPTPR